MAQDLYIEIGTEEIPAGYIWPALESMSERMCRFLDENRVGRGVPKVAGTPRRLVLNIPDVAPRQQPVRTEVVGPPKSTAYDAQGKPTRAAEGFAKGQGVTVGDLSIKQTPKGEYLCVFREEAGLATRELLEKVLPDFIAKTPFPKSMHWSSYSVTFARPIQWIVALLGEEVLAVRVRTREFREKVHGPPVHEPGVDRGERLGEPSRKPQEKLCHPGRGREARTHQERGPKGC